MNNKKGGYIVEAAISLPALIISVCSLILIIKIAMVCEGICFSTVDSLIDIIRNPQENFLSVSLCKRIEKKVLSDESELTDFEVTNIEYACMDGDEEEHILLAAKAGFSVVNPLGINGCITFGEQLIARPMVGVRKSGTPLAEDAFLSGNSKKVVVFPKYGKKYHTKECIYVKRAQNDSAEKLEMEKNDAGLKGYTPCLVCGGAAID